MSKKKTFCSAILLAAGLSTRMGETNKLLLPWKKGVLLEHLIEQIVASKIEELIVVIGHQSDQTIQFVPEHSKVKTVLNSHYATGMTTSIQAGVSKAQSQSTAYMICLGDQVLMETKDYNQLLNQWANLSQKEISQEDNKSILVPTYQKQRGNPVIFSAHYKDAILKHKEPNGCKAIVQANIKHLQTREMDNAHILVDVDTPEAYQQLIKSQ